MRVTNSLPLGCSLLLPVGTVNSVQTLKAGGGGLLANKWNAASLTMNSATQC
jgi:hypothetical protein